MHYCILYARKGLTLESKEHAEALLDEFNKDFSYCNGENNPKYEGLCDWFSDGGRWKNIIKAKRGIIGYAFSDLYKFESVNPASLVEINKPDNEIKNAIGDYTYVDGKDIIYIDKNHIYGIATKSRFYSSEDSNSKFDELFKKITDGCFNGIVIVLDLHM